MKKKKAILVYIKNGYAEIDWILPVLLILKKKFSICFHFSSQLSYQRVKNNKILFSLLQKTSDNYFIQNKYNSLFARLTRYIVSILLKIFKQNFFNQLISNLNNNIHNFHDIKKKYKNYDFKIYFSEFDVLNPWLDTINKKEINIFHYPSTPKFFPKNSNFRPRYTLKGQNLILCNISDKKYWKKNKKKIKIIISGYPKFDTWWRKNFYINKKINKHKKQKIFLFPFGYNLKLYKTSEQKIIVNYVKKVLDIILSNKNNKIIFKLHPRYEGNFFKDITSHINKQRYEVLNSHLFQCLNIADYCLFEPQSSVVLDSLSMKVPAIQLFMDVELKNYTNLSNLYSSAGLCVKTNNYNVLNYLINNPGYLKAKGAVCIKNFYKNYKKSPNESKKIADQIEKIVKRS